MSPESSFPAIVPSTKFPVSVCTNIRRRRFPTEVLVPMPSYVAGCPYNSVMGSPFSPAFDDQY